MVLHQNNKDKLSDSYFEKGTIHHLVPGNKGRVLDGRRTPGFIEKYDEKSAMFIWRITDFEDKGNCWEIPAEEIVAYQFENNSNKLKENEIKKIKSKCDFFSEKIMIYGSESEYNKTLKLIEKEKIKAMDWFMNESQFVRLGKSQLEIQSEVGSSFLYNDLASYMDLCGVLDLETKTSHQYLLNPNSGEWIKGLRIVMAEMGLIDFNEKKPRTSDIFTGIGLKEMRSKYILSRLAFVSSFFELSGYKEVQLFRGMATEGALFEKSKTLISATFNPEVGKAFSIIDRDEKITFSYLIKFTYPIENIFMTYYETMSFNERYREQEAVVLYREKFTF